MPDHTITVRAIETQWKGYRFRSRLEARWAVFFDALGIKWDYEPEGYELSDGARYLPDFWLPTFGGGMFVEVKPDGGDFAKAKRFAAEAEALVWLAEGTPTTRAWYVVGPGADAVSLGIPNADSAEGEDRMFWFPGYEKPDLSIDEGDWPCLGERYLKAVNVARSARFEFGESPE